MDRLLHLRRIGGEFPPLDFDRSSRATVHYSDGNVDIYGFNIAVTISTSGRSHTSISNNTDFALEIGLFELKAMARVVVEHT